MKIQRRQQRPLYLNVADHYRAAIRLGSLSVEQKLPSLREMMGAHEISLSTAVQVCRTLEAEGLVRAQSRSGYFVVGHAAAALDEALAGKDAGHRASVDVSTASADGILAMSRHAVVDVDLAAATCAPELYPGTELRKLTTAVLRKDGGLLVSPARIAGSLAYKKAVVARAMMRGIKTSEDEVIVTQGSSEGLALALKAVTKPGDTVLLESPAYYGALQLLRTLGVDSLELATNAREGLSTDAVEFALRERTRVSAVVNVPTLHNPLGSTSPNEARERLVNLCVAHDIALIEDDAYADLHSGIQLLRAQKSWDRTGHVVYCASFNKSMSPGLRLGWMLGGRWSESIETLKLTQSRPKEELPQRIAARFMDSGSYDRHLRRLRSALARQRLEMAAAVAECHRPPYRGQSVIGM